MFSGPGLMQNVLLSSFAIALLFGGPLRSQTDQPDPALRRVVDLEYPWFARVGMIQGDVEIVATVAPEGKVTRIHVVSGARPLAEAARAALEKWQFAATSATRGRYELRLVFSFVLAGSCDAAEHCPNHFEVDLPDRVRVSAKAIRAMVN
jgi:TonB family protein